MSSLAPHAMHTTLRVAPRAPRRLALAAGVVLALAGAGIGAHRITAPSSHGDVVAAQRIEVPIARGVRAVLQPGAHVKWDGQLVTQSSGDVFFRVEPGTKVAVRTPAGRVELGSSAAATVRVGGQARAFVAVHEGEALLANGETHAVIAAGESAESARDGVVKHATVAEGERAFARNVEQDGDDATDALQEANENLVDQISDYRKRLAEVSSEKSHLEKKLTDTERKLKEAKGPERTRHEYDLTKEDWAELAKDGIVKARMPCLVPEGRTYNAEQLNLLGLAPSDGETMRAAHRRAIEHVWAEIKPLCAEALGTSASAIEKLDTNVCITLIANKTIESTGKLQSYTDALKEVGEIRAGLRSEPGRAAPASPIVRTLLTLTGANARFEEDLARSFGPEEAHRIAFSPGMCSWQNTFQH